MTSVFIVTSSEYPDDDIRAVFETKEQAEAWVGPYANEYTIKEWPLGAERLTPPGMAAYYVMMGRSGQVGQVSAHSENEENAHKGFTYVYIRNFPSHSMNCVHTFMFARDEQHAITIANERRLFLIATDQWSEGEKTAALPT